MKSKAVQPAGVVEEEIAHLLAVLASYSGDELGDGPLVCAGEKPSKTVDQGAEEAGPRGFVRVKAPLKPGHVHGVTKPKDGVVDGEGAVVDDGRGEIDTAPLVRHASLLTPP